MIHPSTERHGQSRTVIGLTRANTRAAVPGPPGGRPGRAGARDGLPRRCRSLSVMSGRVTEHLETELKLEVSPDFVVPDLSGLVEGQSVTEPEVRLLAANYFDTSDLRLAAARITLRRRTGGTDAGWHLKLPLGAATRRELRVPLGDSGTAVPPQLAEQVSAWADGRPLQVVAVLETRRTVRNLVSAGGEILAEVADDLVTGRIPSLGESPAGPVTWREIEVELVSGGPEILAAARTRLVAAGARPSSAASKLGRLLGTAPEA
jgi:inorganic triphosphatase YgiF